ARGQAQDRRPISGVILPDEVLDHQRHVPRCLHTGGKYKGGDFGMRNVVGSHLVRGPAWRENYPSPLYNEPRCLATAYTLRAMCQYGPRTMLHLTVNGESRTLPHPLSIARFLTELGYDSRRVAVEVNQAVVPLPQHPEFQLSNGDSVEIVTLVGGGGLELDPPEDKALTVGKFTFRSRLITGTGKYSSYQLMRDCLAASGCEVTTVAIRRERLVDKEGRNILDFLDLKRYTILPNTAGCFSAEDAVRHARLARELLSNLGNPGADWVKLECLG